MSNGGVKTYGVVVVAGNQWVGGSLEGMPITN